LDIVGLTNTLDNTNPTDATVTVTVRNRAGTVVTGLNAVPATYVPGTTATYRTLAATAAVTPPIGLYEAEAVATKGGVTGREYAVITVEKG
jgi:hypothetical protein